MRWFGPSWDSPVCEEGEHVDTPWQKCEGCKERFVEGERGLVLAYYHPATKAGYVGRWEDFPIHLDCLLEMVT